MMFFDYYEYKLVDIESNTTSDFLLKDEVEEYNTLNKFLSGWFFLE